LFVGYFKYFRHVQADTPTGGCRLAAVPTCRRAALLPCANRAAHRL
jgi:hypothetical protein